MFEVLDRGALAELSDEALISAVTAMTQIESMAAAQRLALIGEVVARQCDDEDDTVAHQVIDGWAWAQAAVAAACNLNPYAASKQMRIAQALRDRLPRTAALFAKGVISSTVIDAITWRTHLVVDEDAIALIDAAISGEAGAYGAHSEKQLIGAVDLWVEKFDPDAVVRSRRAAKDLYVEFDDKDDPNGVASFWGRLRITDKKILEQRLDALADTVCPNDPRRRGELRAAALAALGAVGPALERLACECGDVNCAGSGKDPRAGAVTIYALTDQVPAAGEDTPPQSTPGTAGTPEAEPEPTETAETEPAAPEHEPQAPAAESEPAAPAARTEPAASTKPAEPAAPAASTEPAEPAAPAAGPEPAACNPSPGVMLDGAIIPAAMLAELVAGGATVKPLSEIADLPAERQYRPSTALTAFVRMRAMTCSFPGCNRAAHRCDLDHLIPWPAGATHPGNLGPLCRLHHLVKTFGGWELAAKPDGSIQWTSPTGHTYKKAPGAAILFPHWNIQTPIPRKRAISLINDTDRDTKMPVRQRTRAQGRAQRINTERARNQLELALERAESNSDPPF
ncbi:HNH endonuclease signature motif containing protein [Mycolicibacterium frederiksbergense]|uniref:HNH endonuclease n=1 Tax=Mycolicibacterium frederiksbergense TaxID=117567 RepID=A0A6H0RYW8_9MYCO|nr:HNH endonuclease signature motif containing protein [Mycolicibacterium frederiksbergense]QIV80124.1 HNH endonuclease [Mycolicibacterium frederiksbergense]